MTVVMKISNFFLCDYCDNNAMDVWIDTCHCRAKGMKHVPKKAMLDYHGVGGKRYDEPTDVCKDYEPRKDG